MKHKYLLFLIVALAFLIRFVGISSNPIGFTQDEAGIGYDAYSLLTTGKDQWGNSWPLVLRSFGDFKMPLYSYLSIPFVFVFGLNEFAVRLPGVIIGSLAVLATYFMVKELSGKKKLALWSALFLTLSSWHISLSRGAFEANLTTFFIPIGVWSFIKGVKSPKWMVISAVAFGLNLFSYHSARIFTPLVMISLAFFYRKSLVKSLGSKWSLQNILRKHKLPILTFGIFAFAALFTMFAGAGKRGLDITIFNPTDKWVAVSNRRYEAVLAGAPDFVARMFTNKATYIYKTFTENYISYLSPKFLFINGAGGWDYGMISGRGVLYLFELILVSASLIAFIKKEKFKGMNLILIWILLSPIPAALSKGAGSGTRVAVMIPAIQVLSAYGALYLVSKASKYKSAFRFEKLAPLLILSFLAISSIGFLEDYVYHAPRNAAKSMSYGVGEAMEYLKEVESDYQKIRMSRLLGVPQIWVGFYNKYDPTEFQRASVDWLRYEDEGYVSTDQMDQYSLGKYVFGNLFYERRLDEVGTLFVGRTEEFPDTVTSIKTIYYPNSDPAIIIVDPADN